MDIFEYYIKKQSIDLWYKKFQSTSGKQSGKTFSYYNTNYRYLLSFITQFDVFKDSLGLERKDWKEYLPCGQESNKHRVVNLSLAGFIRKEETAYYITSKGLALWDLSNEELSDNEKWLLLYMLLIDYSSPETHLEIFNNVKNIFHILNSFGLTDEKINDMLKEIIYQTNKIKLFEKDIFWLVTFIKDYDFIKNYISSPKESIDKLKNYVIACSKDRKSTDLIAHKYVASGVYSGFAFNDDIKVIYFTHLLLSLINESFEQYVDGIVNAYCSIFENTNKEKILNFIKNHKSIYIKVKQNTLGGI